MLCLYSCQQEAGSSFAIRPFWNLWKDIFDPCIESGAFWTQRVQGVRGTPKGQLGALLDILCWSAFLSEIAGLQTKWCLPVSPGELNRSVGATTGRQGKSGSWRRKFKTLTSLN